jgi:hypothetical protein
MVTSRGIDLPAKSNEDLAWALFSTAEKPRAGYAHSRAYPFDSLGKITK